MGAGDRTKVIERRFALGEQGIAGGNGWGEVEGREMVRSWER